jgi:dGTPase
MSRPRIEQSAAAPFASRPERSRGRLHAEPASATRTEFQRDRDRIIHAAAFRRLQHKTQVFIYNVGDHYRTRLTHSLEVAQIARSAARALGLDEDLAEAVALAHDLGHPPFGHAGEEALNAAMKDWGGFDHNAQALRIVTTLERQYARFDGLNLSWEALEGMVKHNGPLVGQYSRSKRLPAAIAAYAESHDLELATFAGPEAQIAALADDTAYINHDLDDGVRAGLFGLDELRDVPLVGPMLREVTDLYGVIDKVEPARAMHEAVRRLIDRMIGDMLAETGRRAAAAGPQSAADVRAMERPLVAFSGAMAAEVKTLRGFLYENMYRHSRVSRDAATGAAVVAELFRRYLADPATLPDEWRAGDDLPVPARARRVADFIAGMTDRFAMAEHERLFQTRGRQFAAR